jgi:hypothetical protein
MSEKRKNENKNKRELEYADLEDPQLSVVLTGYEQVSEELRYFGQRLHRSYYLLISTTVLLIGLGVEEIVDWSSVLLLGGTIFCVTGYMMFRFRVKQRSAAIIRRHIEELISEGAVNSIEYPLQVQKGVWANITRFGEAPDLAYVSNYDEITTLRPILTSRFLSQTVMVTGVIFIGMGLYLVLC